METPLPQRSVRTTSTWAGLERLRERFAGRLVTPGDDPDNVFRLNQNITP